MLENEKAPTYWEEEITLVDLENAVNPENVVTNINILDEQASFIKAYSEEYGVDYSKALSDIISLGLDLAIAAIKNQVILHTLPREDLF